MLTCLGRNHAAMSFYGQASFVQLSSFVSKDIVADLACIVPRGFMMYTQYRIWIKANYRFHVGFSCQDQNRSPTREIPNAQVQTTFG